MHHPSSPDSVLAQQELEHKPPTPGAANGVELERRLASYMFINKQACHQVPQKKLRHAGMNVLV